MSNKILRLGEKYFDVSNIRGRVLWLVYYCIKNEIHDISAKSHFIRKCGLGNSFISDLENKEDQTPTDRNLRKIVSGIGVNREWLYHGTGDPFPEQNNYVNEEPAPYGTSVESKNATVLIPFYKQVKPSAGGGSIIVPDDESDKIYVSLPRSYVIRKLHANPSEVIILEIWNDSMEPEIKNGDVVFMTRDVKPLQDGEIYILRVGESLLCKYIHVLPGNRLKVSSANSRFPDFEVQLGDESQESFEIYGRIVGHLHSRL